MSGSYSLLPRYSAQHNLLVSSFLAMEERKFTLDDVRDYLENTGALREAELLLTGKASLGFIPTIRRKDTTTKDGDVNSRRRSDSLEKALSSMLDPKSSDDEKNMVRMDEVLSSLSNKDDYNKIPNYHLLTCFIHHTYIFLRRKHLFPSSRWIVGRI